MYASLFSKKYDDFKGRRKVWEQDLKILWASELVLQIHTRKTHTYTHTHYTQIHCKSIVNINTILKILYCYNEIVNRKYIVLATFLVPEDDQQWRGLSFLSVKFSVSEPIAFSSLSMLTILFNLTLVSFEKTGTLTISSYWLPRFERLRPLFHHPKLKKIKSQKLVIYQNNTTVSFLQAIFQHLDHVVLYALFFLLCWCFLYILTLLRIRICF